MSVEVTRSTEGLRLARLDMFFMELLRQIPVSADPSDNAAARERIFPQAMADDDALNEDWVAYVHPELKQLFATAGDVVREDLKKFEELDDSHENWAFDIPTAHFDQWLSVLNQARLSLAARFGFGEKEMGQHGPGTIDTVRDLSLFQVHFYGFLQECLLQDIAG